MNKKFRLSIIIFTVFISFFLYYYFLNNIQAEDNSLEDGIYIIKSSINENYVFDIYDNSNENGANLELWENNKGNNQKFNIKKLDNGYYKIMAIHSEKCIDVEGNKKQAGTNVLQWGDNGQDNQQWVIKNVGDENYNIISKSNGLCLDIPYSEVKSGSNVQVWTHNSGKNQLFKFKKIVEDTNKIENETNQQESDLETNTNNMENNENYETEEKEELIEKKRTINDGIYTIKTALDERYVVDLYNYSNENGAKAELWINKDSMNQKFNIKYLNDGYYTISPVYSNKKLDVEGASDKSGTRVIQWKDIGASNQQWIIKDAGNGNYNIISKCNGLYLDVTNSEVKNGTNIIVWEKNGGINQLFKFEEAIYEIEGIKTIENGNYSIKLMEDNDKTLDIEEISQENGANLAIWKNNNGSNQRFKVHYLNNGCYKIYANHSGKCLDVEGASEKEGTNVVQWSENEGDNQQWIILDAGDGYYNIMSKCNGLYLTVVNGNICVTKPKDSDNQKFKFYNLRNLQWAGVYGISGLKENGNNNGSDLIYYQYGNGENVLFATFSVHGFEDNWEHDGIELVKTANAFWERLKLNNTNIGDKWTIYIFPEVNPDGRRHGWTNNGPGRTTLYSMAPLNKGIDLNRCWSSDWVYQSSDRYYTGTEPFQAYEARCLREFLLQHKSKNKQTLLVDLHGWTQQLIGDPDIRGFYRKYFPENADTPTYGKGYLINWARNNLGSTNKQAKSALIELPSYIKNSQDVDNYNLKNKYIDATLDMLEGIN